jgi:hypothetical protein
MSNNKISFGIKAISDNVGISVNQQCTNDYGQILKYFDLNKATLKLEWFKKCCVNARYIIEPFQNE